MFIYRITFPISPQLLYLYLLGVTISKIFVNTSLHINISIKAEYNFLNIELIRIVFEKKENGGLPILFSEATMKM